MENASITTSPVTNNASRLSREDFQRVIRRITRDHGVSEKHAEIMLHGALDFLTLSSKHRGMQFTPSKEVDDAWHTFLLYSRAYSSFTAGLGVRLFHEPNDGPMKHVGGYARTLRFMKDHGIAYDHRLWSEQALVGDSVADPSTCCSEDVTDVTATRAVH